MRNLLWMLGVGAIFCQGCGGGDEGDRAVSLPKYKAQCDALREKFKKIAGMIPAAPVTGDSPKRELTPPPMSWKNGRSNYEVVHLVQLTEPEARPGGKGETAWLQYSNRVLDCLRWTGPQAKDFLQARYLENTFKEGLATRYIVVVRTVRFSPITDTGQIDPVSSERVKIYSGGDLAMEAFLVDLTRPEVVGSFTLAANIEGLKVKTAREFDDRLADRVFAEIRNGLTRISNAQFGVD